MKRKHDWLYLLLSEWLNSNPKARVKMAETSPLLHKYILTPFEQVVRVQVDDMLEIKSVLASIIGQVIKNNTASKKRAYGGGVVACESAPKSLRAAE